MLDTRVALARGIASLHENMITAGWDNDLSMTPQLVVLHRNSGNFVDVRHVETDNRLWDDGPPGTVIDAMPLPHAIAGWFVGIGFSMEGWALSADAPGARVAAGTRTIFRHPKRRSSRNTFGLSVDGEFINILEYEGAAHSVTVNSWEDGNAWACLNASVPSALGRMVWRVKEMAGIE